MSRHGSAVGRVASSGSPWWDASLSRMSIDGLCDWMWGASVSFNSGFSAAC
jgi:hypothetical protein